MCREGSPTRHWKMALCSLSTGQDGNVVLGGLAGDFLPGHDEDFLAGDGDGLAGPDGGERGGESGGADDGDEYHVGLGHGSELDETLGATVTGGAVGELAADGVKSGGIVKGDGAVIEAAAHMRPAEGEADVAYLRQRAIAGIAIDLEDALKAGKVRNRL